MSIFINVFIHFQEINEYEMNNLNNKLTHTALLLNNMLVSITDREKQKNTHTTHTYFALITAQ